jgi:hypothetical protein
MNTKNYICILAGAALLVSCTEEKKNEAPTTPHRHGQIKGSSSPTPMPSPVPVPGKRTETGTVIGLTATQITLRTSAHGTWIISRTDDNTKVISGTLTLGATSVTIEFWVPPGHPVAA